MPPPIILIDSATGSDTAASGAGPATAISGSTGRTRNTASQLRFGLFGATDDLSGVVTDGSAALFCSISTAGQRNFSAISAVKNTRHVDVGSITSGAAILSGIASTSGWSVGDVIRVNGAGAASANLFSTILTVDSGTQVTLNDNAGTTVAGAVVENPKQVSLTSGQGVNTGTTDTAWAIGGRRASIGGTNSRKLFDNNSAAGDVMPGWIVEMKSGHSETLSSTLTFRRDGDTTSGLIVLRGESGAATLPLLTFSNNGVAIGLTTVSLNNVILANFELRNSNATKTASTAVDLGSNNFSNSCSLIGLKIGHSTNKFWRGILPAQYSRIIGCEIGHCAEMGINGHAAGFSTGCSMGIIINCYIHRCTSHGINLDINGSQSGGKVINNILYLNGGNGIRITVSREALIMGNTCDANTASGISLTANASRLFVAINNICSNNGAWGFNFNGDSAALLAAAIIDCNNTHNNTSGAYSTSGVATNDPGLNPSYTNAASGDFSIGTNLASKGYPVGGTLPIGRSSTFSYVDPGAAQRQPSGGGSSSILPRLTNGGFA